MERRSRGRDDGGGVFGRGGRGVRDVQVVDGVRVEYGMSLMRNGAVVL
jgi:hypothetical protein